MKKHLTKRDKERYVKRGFAHCPYCGADDIEGDGVEIDANGAAQRVWCLNPECQAVWFDLYTLTGIEEYATPKGGGDREG